MKPPFDLVIIHGDGARLLRVRVPRPVMWVMLALIAALPVAGVTLTGDWALVRHQRGRISALRQETDRQRALFATFRTQLSAVRAELVEWQALHAKMWQAFGPDRGADGQTSAVGGPVVPEAAPATMLRPAEEIAALTSSMEEERPRLRELEDLVSRTGEMMSRLPLAWPVHGRLSSSYGHRRSPWNGRPEEHEGLDIGSPSGTSVQSPAPGTVVTASGGGGYGRHVVVDHGNGVRSLYGHLSKIDVKPGQQVEKGETIGRVGSTGHSTGPHLHYEIRVEGKPVDPRGFLPQ